jgi:hypothetical protein
MLTKAEKRRKAIVAKNKAARAGWPFRFLRKPRRSWNQKVYKLSISLPSYMLVEAKSYRRGATAFFIDLYHYKFGKPRLAIEEKAKIKRKLGDRTKMAPKRRYPEKRAKARAARHKKNYIPHGKVGRPRKDKLDERQGPG